MTRAERTAIHSLPAIELENEVLALSILPEPGAKIWQIHSKIRGRDILWRNPRIPPCSFPIDSNFDNYWCGGWDEGFPTCDSCEYKGEIYPNLGELRSLRWEVEAFGAHNDGLVAELLAFGPITPVRATKYIRLEGATVSVAYSIRNIGHTPLEFIWGSHPALAVTAQTILHIPASTGVVQIASSSQMGSPGCSYRWPHLETPSGIVDMRRVQAPQAGIYGGHYAIDLTAGGYGVEFADENLGLIVQFDPVACPYLWLWLVYGGWRGYHHVIIEPWTSKPVNLSEAVAKNTHRSLAPGETFSTEVRLTVFTDLQEWHHEMKRNNLE